MSNKLTKEGKQKESEWALIIAQHLKCKGCEHKCSRHIMSCIKAHEIARDIILKEGVTCRQKQG